MFKKLRKRLRKAMRPDYDRKRYENVLEDPDSKF